MPAARACFSVSLVSSAVTSTRIGLARACRAAKSSASRAPALWPPGALASGVPDALAAASAARRGADSPRASNTKPLRSTAATTFTARGSRLSFAIIAASARPICPKPSNMTSVRVRRVIAPPPILESWKASCTMRCARAASRASTTTEMFSSDDPWAIAMTLIPACASAPNTRAAIPGVPAIPSPTTTSVATPGRTSTPSISRRAISLWNSSTRLARARSAAASGTPKQMECSDDAWVMSETEIPLRWTAAKVRAAMPGTPSIPFPSTVSSACPVTAESAFTG